MKRVEFYYDLVSPCSYLAYGRVKRVYKEQGAELVLRPMLLGAVHKAVELQAPIEIQNKGRYQLRTSTGGPGTTGCRCSSRSRSLSAL